MSFFLVAIAFFKLFVALSGPLCHYRYSGKLLASWKVLLKKRERKLEGESPRGGEKVIHSRKAPLPFWSLLGDLFVLFGSLAHFFASIAPLLVICFCVLSGLLFQTLFFLFFGGPRAPKLTFWVVPGW